MHRSLWASASGRGRRSARFGCLSTPFVTGDKGGRELTIAPCDIRRKVVFGGDCAQTVEPAQWLTQVQLHRVSSYRESRRSGCIGHQGPSVSAIPSVPQVGDRCAWGSLLALHHLPRGD